MFINPTIRRCVAFVACKRKSGFEVRGTAFFVGYPLKPYSAAVSYIVTAKHVIEGLDKLTPGENVFLRLNTKEGVAKLVEVPRNQWVFSEDDRVDVAVAPFPGIFDLLEQSMIGLEMIATERRVTDEYVSAGHEIFFPGLFTQHHGMNKNIPIIRRGSIAAMPEDRIATKYGNVKGYLIEARSIGGLSGSPVFVWIEGGIAMRNNRPTGVKSALYLIGLVHGHFDGTDSLHSIGSDTVSMDAAMNVINTGIAVVVPSDDILAVLEVPSLVATRELCLQQLAAESTEKPN